MWMDAADERLTLFPGITSCKEHVHLEFTIVAFPSMCCRLPRNEASLD